MTPDDFSRLGAHLQSLKPCVSQFCQKHGFEPVSGSSIGRYPRIRIQQETDVTRWIDLWMGLNEKGERFTEFFPEIPYELSAGASVYQICENKELWRHQKSIIIWPSKPFNEVGDALSDALEIGILSIKGWTEAFLKAEGMRVLIKDPA